MNTSRRILLFVIAVIVFIPPILAQSPSVTIGPEGQVLTTFERGGETYTLVGNDEIEFVDNGEGVLHFETVVIDATREPVIDLNVLYEATDIERTGPAFNDPLDPRFTGDLDAILSSTCLIRGNVYDVLFDRAERRPLVEISDVSDVDIRSESGTIIVGDPDNDLFNIIVVTGQINVTITHTLTTTPQFVDTLTIQLFASEAPTGATVTVDAEGRVLTSFERDGEIHTLVDNATLDFSSEGGERVLSIATVVKNALHPPLIELDLVFEQTDIAPTGQAFNVPLDPRFAGDLDDILGANSLTRFDVSDLLYDRVDQPTLENIVSVLGITPFQTPGTVFIGDVDDPLNIDVLFGHVTVIIPILTSTTPHSEDTMTIQLFQGAEPMPGTNLDLCPPPDGDGRLDACDLLLILEEMQSGGIPEEQLFGVSQDWLEEGLDGQ